MSRVSFDQLFLPKDGLMECLKAVGVKPGILSLSKVMDHMKDYIMERKLYDPNIPTMVVCGEDPLGKVLGVERFLVKEAIGLLVKQMYAVQPQHVVSQGTTIKRELPSGANGTNATQDGKRARVEADSTSGASASSAPSPVHLYIPPSPGYDSGPETEYSYQGHETEVVKDTSDDLWFLEESSSDVSSSDDEATQRRLLRVAALAAQLLQREEEEGRHSDDCPFEVEYEIEEESDNDQARKAGSVSSDSDIEEVAQAEILICVNDDDAQFWADSSDSYSSDSEIGDADLWQCRVCGMECAPHGMSAVQRYCTSCWKDRFGWLPDREERHPPQKNRRRVRRRNGERASACHAADARGPSGVNGSHRLRLNSAGEESRPSSSCNGSDKSPPESSSSVSNTDGSQESLSGGSTSEKHLHTDETKEGNTFVVVTPGTSQERSDDWSQPSCSTDRQDSDVPAFRRATVAADTCSICMARPKCGILVHGRTSHRLTCYKCALQLQKRNQPCPVCRRRIQRVVRNFDA